MGFITHEKFLATKHFQTTVYIYIYIYIYVYLYPTEAIHQRNKVCCIAAITV